MRQVWGKKINWGKTVAKCEAKKLPEARLRQIWGEKITRGSFEAKKLPEAFASSASYVATALDYIQSYKHIMLT